MLRRDADALREVVLRAVSVKAEVVSLALLTLRRVSRAKKVIAHDVAHPWMSYVNALETLLTL